MENYSNKDYTFILKSLSASVFEALAEGYNYNGTDIYNFLIMRLNSVVINNNHQAKDLIAALIDKLNEASKPIDEDTRKVKDPVGMDIFMGMIRNVIIDLIDSYEVTKNEIVVAYDGYPVHIVETSFKYGDSAWVMTVQNQNMGDHLPQHHKLNGVDNATLTADESMIASLLGTITTLIAIEKESDLLAQAAIANPAVVKKAEEIQKIYGKTVNDHLEIALILYSLTDYSVNDNIEAQTVALYIQKTSGYTAAQILDPKFLQEEFGFNKGQAKAMKKIFSKKQRPIMTMPFGLKLFSGENAHKNPDDFPLKAAFDDLPKKDGEK